jgi:hypothetical protein
VSLVLNPFILVPTIGLFVVALVTGRRWLFLVPILGWPIIFFLPYLIPPEPSDFAPWALLVEVVAGVVAVTIGLILHHAFVWMVRSRPGDS